MDRRHEAFLIMPTHTSSAPGTEQHKNSRLPLKEDQVDIIDTIAAATCTEAQ